MGARIEISRVGDKYDEENLAPFLGRDFHFEITRGALWEHHAPFLTPEEAQLLEAPYCEEFDANPPVPVDPAELARVLTKVKDYLWTHQDSLPYEIHLDYERMEREGLPTDIIINQSRCWIHGDTLYNSQPWWPSPMTAHRVQITNFPHEPNKVDMMVDIKEQIEIEGRTYYLTRMNRHEVFAPVLDQVIAFCNHASSLGEQVYWIYRH